MSHDLVITGGTVVDGTGAEPHTADVAIDGDRITAVGKVDGAADADDRRRRRRSSRPASSTSTPTTTGRPRGTAAWRRRRGTASPPWSWATAASASPRCGPRDHDRLIELMEGVEDIPGTALHEGLDWSWQSFAEYLDALDRRRRDIDVAAQVPHGARAPVRHGRARRRPRATPPPTRSSRWVASPARRSRPARSASPRRGRRNHRTQQRRATRRRSRPTPTSWSASPRARRIGKGVLQVVSRLRRPRRRDGRRSSRMAEASGRPLSISLAAGRPHAGLRTAGSSPRSRDANAARPARHGPGRRTGDRHPARPAGDDEPAQRIADRASPRRSAVRRAARRAAATRPCATAIIAELGDAREPVGRASDMFRAGDPPDYEPPPEHSVAADGRRGRDHAGRRSPTTTCSDDGGTALLYVPFLNYADGNLDAAREMLAPEHTVLGLGDGGAHVGTICDASFPTTLLTHWVPRPQPWRAARPAHVIAKQTSRTAARSSACTTAACSPPGMRADVNVIDLDGLTLHPPACCVRPARRRQAPAAARRRLPAHVRRRRRDVRRRRAHGRAARPPRPRRPPAPRPPDPPEDHR